jgi:hypothetical protein
VSGRYRSPHEKSLYPQPRKIGHFALSRATVVEETITLIGTTFNFPSSSSGFVQRPLGCCGRDWNSTANIRPVLLPGNLDEIARVRTRRVSIRLSRANQFNQFAGLDQTIGGYNIGGSGQWTGLDTLVLPPVVAPADLFPGPGLPVTARLTDTQTAVAMTAGGGLDMKFGR